MPDGLSALESLAMNPTVVAQLLLVPFLPCGVDVGQEVEPIQHPNVLMISIDGLND